MSALPQVGVVTGLAAEAERLTKTGRAPLLFVSGSDPGRAFEGARRLAANGAAGLVSFGIAGGLDPKLAAGTVVLARAVISDDGTTYAADRDWRLRVLAELAGRIEVEAGVVAGWNRPVLSAGDKRKLFEATGASAVDMESHAVAAAAREFSLPFLALRAISDPAARSLPPWILAGLDGSGRARPLAVFAKALMRPWEIPGLLGLGEETWAAFESLSRVAEIGALLTLPA